jgi:competence protein ComEC
VQTVAAIPALALVAGCAAALAGANLYPLLATVFLIAAAGAATVAYRTSHASVCAVSVACGFACGGVLLGADAWQRAWRPPLRVLFESIAQDKRLEAARFGQLQPEDAAVAMSLVGVLREDAAVSNGGVSLSLQVSWAGRARSFDERLDPAANPARGGVLLTVAGSLAAERAGEWRAGRTVRTVALLRRPARYLDPGVPDLERALARRGTTLVGTVKSAALVEVTARGSPAAELAASARAYARLAIGAAVGRWSAQSAAIVTAIVIGDRSALDDRVERTLQEAGTYHVIAISGGNIAILAGLTLAMFRLVGLFGRAAMLSATAALVCYGAVVSGGASVERATLMAVVYFLGRVIDLRGPPLNTLALVAGLLTIVDPLVVGDPAFLLTFGATAAILAVLPVVAELRLRKPLGPAGAMLVAMFAASVAAEVALMPVAASLFSRVTFAGLFLNFAAIPLMAVAQIAGMTVVPLFALSAPAAEVAGAIAHAGAEGLVRSAGLVAFMPAATWRVAPPGIAPLAMYYAGLVVAWRRWRRRAVIGSAESATKRLVRQISAALSVGAAVWILAEPWALLARKGDGRLHVTFIDVGQGDAALVRLPRGTAFLVDTGGLGGTASFDVGDRIVAPVLRGSGVGRLAALVLTHGDADHVGGAPSIVGEFRPLDIWEGIPVPPFEPLSALRVAARDQRLRWSNVQKDDTVFMDDVRISVKHPGRADWERQRVRNDDSVVLEIEWRDVSVVLAGDIGREAEAAIAPTFAPSPLRILKVPHHGSLTSSSQEFLRSLAPRVAVASVGRSNAFGHPAPAVLQRYQDIGAEIFRTDRDGAVNIDSDGTSLEIHTFTGRAMHVGALEPKPPRRHEDTKSINVSSPRGDVR